MLLNPRTLACAAPAELDTDAIRNRDSGMFDSIDTLPHTLHFHVLIILDREVDGTLVGHAIESTDETCTHPKQAWPSNLYRAWQMISFPD